MAPSRLWARCGAFGVASVLAAGCGFHGVSSFSLPGGADLGDRPYRVRIEFSDVLDLVSQAGVKVDDVAVGRVEDIDVGPDGWSAAVTVAVNGDVALPANAEAHLKQSSLLGEKFVELARPGGETAAGKLADGAVIPLARTTRNVEVEEVFGAVSLLLNGGGVGQVQQIIDELNKALGGNEPEIRRLFADLDTVVADLDAHRAEITRALDGVNRLASTLNTQRAHMEDVLGGLGPGIGVLAQQRQALVTMLASLDSLSSVAVGTVRKAKDDLVADLKALAPIMRSLADAGQALPKAFQSLLTFPFPDEAMDAFAGDYLNVFVDVDQRPAGEPTAVGSPGAPVFPLLPMDPPRGDGQ